MVTRTLAYDTRVLPPGHLTGEEQEILFGINELIKQVKKASESKGNSGRPRDLRRASLEQDRRNNIIMLDGERGAGKTSLLLTLLKGWSCPEYFKEIDQEIEFQEMKDIVLALHPIDFDPLPPDMSLYSWIIQAFAPLVDSLCGKTRTRFMEPQEYEYDSPDDTLNGRFRRLRHAAAVGWSTGQLKRRLGKDAESFLVLQGEQQSNWQRLKDNWQDFLGMLLKGLENADQLSSSYKLPKDGILVLPIDDLDLQVERNPRVVACASPVEA